MTNAALKSDVELGSAYSTPEHDALNPKSLLSAEVQQRRETGYDVDAIVEEANNTNPDDRNAVFSLVDRFSETHRTNDWTFVEPDGLDEIGATLTALPAATQVDAGLVSDKIHAAWLGRIAGCNLGKPVEAGDYWTVERISDYLHLTDSYPLTDYFVHRDPMPEGFEFRDNWPQTTRGNVSGSARDDDIDYPILALHLLESHGSDITPALVGQAWLSLFPLTQVYTAERAAYINLTNGLTSPETATHRNPYREWIGAQIRGDVFGYVFPGNPWRAAALSFQDASLSHVGNGIYGEMWAAALVSAAFTAANARDAVVVSLTVVPPLSRLAEAIQNVLDLHEEGKTWEQALSIIRTRYGSYSWVHTINNAAVVVAALLWADGDFTTALGRAVMSGWDTDSNGATVGSVAAILAGTAGLPHRLIAPLENRTRSALFGFDNSTISDLADRTVRLTTQGLQ